MGNEVIQFIKNAGGCVVSKNILTGNGKLKWMVRESSNNSADNGWRFFSDIDDDEYCSDAENFEVCDFNFVANIEPAILGIYLYPVGSDLQLVSENGKLKFYDNMTEQVVQPIYNI